MPHLTALPDFLWNLAALANFMRLSLLKAAHAVLDEPRTGNPGQIICIDPSPSGLGYVWRAGPPGLDDVLGRRLHHSGVTDNRPAEICGIPHLAKNERDAPNFLHAAPDKTACAPFFKERRIKFAEPYRRHRKSGMWGTRRLRNPTDPTASSWLVRLLGLSPGPDRPGWCWARSGRLLCPCGRR